jgi:hypothetical protein
LCGRGRQHAGGQPAVDLLAVRRGLDEIGVAVFLHQLGDAVERIFPGNPRPFIRSGRAMLGVLQTARTMNEVDQARALRAQRAAIHWMIGIAFDMDDAGLGVLGVVAESVHQDAAAYGAVRAGIAGFSGTRQLVLTDFR